MSSAVSTALSTVVHRLTGRLKPVAARRYRDLLARPDRAAFRVFMLVAALFDHAVRVARWATHAPRELRLLRRRAARARQRFVHRHDLVVEAATVGAGDQLSLRLRGPDAALAAADAVALRPLDGSDLVRLPTVRRRSGSTLRLAATVPRAAFADDSRSSYRLVVLDGSRDLGAVIPDPSAVLRRWPKDSDDRPWPPRLELTGTELRISGYATGATVIPHLVTVGVATATVSWDGDPAAAGELRLELRRTEPDTDADTVVTADAAGAHSARIAYAALSPGVWRAAVRRIADPGRWEPLTVDPGQFPDLSAGAPLGTVPLRRADGVETTVRVAYNGANQLTFTVGRAR